VEPAVGDADDLRPLLVEHLPVVGVGVFRAEALRRGGAALVVLVGDGHDFNVVHGLPDDVEAVAVVALAGAADDGDAVGLRHGPPRSGGGPPSPRVAGAPPRNGLTSPSSRLSSPPRRAGYGRCRRAPSATPSPGRRRRSAGCPAPA